MAIEPEIKEVLDKHESTLKEHTDDINLLKIEAEVSKERYNIISSQLSRIENNSLASNATNTALLASQKSMTETIKKLADSNTTTNTNNAEVVKVKNNNNKDVTLKVLGIVLILILGYFAMKGITISVPTF